ncbi:hypothetical protein [Nitrosopumilus adriaticus]|uniref:Uncharacterized protein n=1 Tax=Nitrosopumilus adriaticus TaxID=1580092 RepID=A0A0D5C0Q7_9ARCH|nr:hypothetical protein [Nitrosopumilus adriaticus]AJW69905.1 hypothetical protein NADRNF5_0206 [Nitrosopumilus adriaticus]
MELNTERRLVRCALIVSIICGVSWMAMWDLSNLADSQNNVILGTQIAVSGFGEITLFDPQKVDLFSVNVYQDSQLGFQISKPNDIWEIHSVLDDLNSDELVSLKTKGFLDGVYVEQNHDRRFMVTVFDIRQENFSLHAYIDNQIALMESKNAIIPFEQVSPQNDWALFAVEVSDRTNQYGEQMLFLKDNRLYMLQYSGTSPQSLDSDQKDDFKQIMDSFEVI